MEKEYLFKRNLYLGITTAGNVTKDNEWLWVLVRTNFVRSVALPLIQSPFKVIFSHPIRILEMTCKKHKVIAIQELCDFCCTTRDRENGVGLP